MLVRILLLVAVVGSPLQVQANNAFNKAKVMSIVLHDWGDVLINLESGVTKGEDCTNKSYLVLKRSNQHFSEMFSSLLAAYHAGSSVAGWVNGCREKLESPILTRLDLVAK